MITDHANLGKPLREDNAVKLLQLVEASIPMTSWLSILYVLPMYLANVYFLFCSLFCPHYNKQNSRLASVRRQSWHLICCTQRAFWSLLWIWVILPSLVKVCYSANLCDFLLSVLNISSLLMTTSRLASVRRQSWHLICCTHREFWSFLWFWVITPSPVIVCYSANLCACLFSVLNISSLLMTTSRLASVRRQSWHQICCIRREPIGPLSRSWRASPRNPDCPVWLAGRWSS